MATSTAKDADVAGSTNNPLGKMVISMAGLLAAGKTEFASKIANKFQITLLKEPVVSNQYLGEFYADIKANAFMYQVYLLNERYAQQQRAIWNPDGAVMDRSIYEDGIFVKSLLSQGLILEKEADVYFGLFRNISNQLARPDLIIFLDVSPEVSLQRIKERGRECEAAVTLEYLQALHKEYQTFINEIHKKIRVIRVPWNKFTDPTKLASLLHRVYLQSTENFIDLEPYMKAEESRLNAHDDDDDYGGEEFTGAIDFGLNQRTITHVDGVKVAEHS